MAVVDGAVAVGTVVAVDFVAAVAVTVVAVAIDACGDTVADDVVGVAAVVGESLADAPRDLAVVTTEPPGD